MPSTPQQSVIGVFKGMGDLLWASPLICAELDRGTVVHLLVFPNPALVEFCSLLDFGINAHKLHLQQIPRGLRGLRRFFAQMRSLSPQLVWISPHAPAADSSWRIPLLLRLTQQLFWADARLAGASSERFSWLFHHRIDLDRTLPLPRREWTAYSSLRPQEALPDSPRPHFISALTDQRSRPALYDLVIHPGANARNRVWPVEKYPALLAALPGHWRIAVVALPADMAALVAVLPPSSLERYTLLSGTLQQAIQTLASSRMAFVMNSGTMHFADVLGVPAVAIFGQQNPTEVIAEGCIFPVYRPTVPCQPCGYATCGQPEVYCLTNIDPVDVARTLIQLEATIPPSSGGSVLSLTQIRQTTL